MKSISVHKIDDETELALVERAREEGVSLNVCIKNILRDALGTGGKKLSHRRDFAEFCGSWSETQASEFDDAVSTFSEIDDDLWE